MLHKAAAYNGFRGIMLYSSTFDNYFTLAAVNKGVLGQEVARGGRRTSDFGRQTSDWTVGILRSESPRSEVRRLTSEVRV
jgi:hypothetical protein